MAGKKYKKAKEEFGDEPSQSLEQALGLVKKAIFANFDETLEVAIRLGVNPKHADQMVRGTVVLPHGLGISRRVCVVASGEKMKEAEDAGAEIVGGDDLVAKIQKGFMDFDAVVATPDMMRSVGKLGKILGPRGLMPNPKTGTVTFEVAKAVKEIKAVGKMSFSEDKLLENLKTLIDSVLKAKPAAAKGRYVKTIAISSTMGPGVRIDPIAVGAK